METQNTNKPTNKFDAALESVRASLKGVINSETLTKTEATEISTVLSLLIEDFKNAITEIKSMEEKIRVDDLLAENENRKVIVTHNGIELVTDSADTETYHISFRNMDQYRFIGWLLHLSDKKWMTMEHVKQMILKVKDLGFIHFERP